MTNPAAVADFLNLDNWTMLWVGEELLGYHNNNGKMSVSFLAV